MRCRSERPAAFAAGRTIRAGYLEGHISDGKFIALPGGTSLLILLERGCRPLKLPRRRALPLHDAPVNLPKFLRSVFPTRQESTFTM
jgi:hypothetical protein